MSSPTTAKAAPPPDALPRASFAAIAFYASDKLRFFQFPEPVCREGAGQVIRASWPDGVQSESYHVGTAAYEYKLGGRPFGSTGEAAGLGARVLVRNLLAYLHSLGWLLDASLSQARDVASKDTLIFRQPRGGGDAAAAAAAGPQPRWLAIALTSGDRLRFLGGCGDGDGDGTLVGDLRRELQRLGLLARGQRKTDQGVAAGSVEAGYEFKLQRSMWRAEFGENVLQARVLTLRVAEVLDSFGWRSYATVRQREGAENFIKTDTWYFINTGE
ncbi:hypothetical protein RB595_000529 [Gaeumannomyces hyphopodioides]